MAGISLFSKTRELEAQTEEFCDKVAEGLLAFKLGVSRYLDGDIAAFDEKKQQVSALESRGDELRRQIQRRLYVETLIPNLGPMYWNCWRIRTKFSMRARVRCGSSP